MRYHEALDTPIATPQSVQWEGSSSSQHRSSERLQEQIGPNASPAPRPAQEHERSGGAESEPAIAQVRRSSVDRIPLIRAASGFADDAPDRGRSDSGARTPSRLRSRVARVRIPHTEQSGEAPMSVSGRPGGTGNTIPAPAVGFSAALKTTGNCPTPGSRRPPSAAVRLGGDG